MDALALLCNLHADGPATLQRLRRAGCASLESLLEMDALALSEHVGQDERFAERVLREGELLAARLEGVEWEDDEDEFEDEESSEEELAAEDDAEEFDEEEVERVLDTWRDLDRSTPPSAPNVYVEPQPAIDPRVDAELGTAGIHNLAPDLCARLGELGVRTLRDLADAPTLELAGRIPLAFTRLKHLQFLARRERERRAAMHPPPETPLVPPTPAAETSQFETAGPFA